MKEIIFHPLAQQELDDAIGYYKTQDKAIALEFLNTVESSTNLLARYPELGLKFRDSVRRLAISKFPYSLVYRLLDGEQIYILAIAHHKQKPNAHVGK
ncbi:type II toxin-antitoxin system RelE/ParE family toxin [Pseudanabaena sp. FACHB-1277]|uniref:Type II toxin-antitoxin system RelE/ParE family toxin n=1 Tax=Pseudanabaena cinerea FACHB-1277 TaxID=2949581 RepID=A0A926UXK7_9CYAN|nr:type II toxin-antitoxin system RelE/ParE family toxin [Pseudanabaena cinerea]MBD2152843.1 type II toxin-antitoxin system RelE/ParE family toxin [Pseudanabaena cinerea FACHB-1277]